MWLAREWSYQNRKFDQGHRNRDTTTFGTEDDEWKRALDMYYGRAKILGLENPLGRQALAKMVATSVAMLDNVIERYGQLPPPGTPSGNME
jgi:hypothetical protein